MLKNIDTLSNLKASRFIMSGLIVLDIHMCKYYD